MTITNFIEKIAAAWPAYLEKGVVDKSDTAYSLVVNQSQEVLRPFLDGYEHLMVKGSTGEGNITAAPWIALLDSRITNSATREYYVVYLFSVDMSTVTLTLAFGTTQFEKQFGGTKRAFPRMRSAAFRLQEMFAHLIPEGMERGPIKLAARPRQKLHYAYQQSAILAYPPYRLDALPEERQLVADLQRLVGIYAGMVSDPLEATVERLVEAVVEPAAGSQTILVHDFEPHSPAKERRARSADHSNRRYSPESRKVGDAGERVVLQYEKERLMSAGRKDLADQVRWHAQERDYVGWDITSYELDGSEIYIEVKSSLGKTISSVPVTINEWEAARNPTRRERYYLYVVTGALSTKPVIERLCNPAAYVETGQLSCEPIVFELDLRQE